MSYEIIYQRAFLKTNRNTVVPFVLAGCNNLTTVEYARNGKRYERRVREWGSYVYNMFINGDYKIDFKKNEMLVALCNCFAEHPDRCIDTKYNGKWLNNASEKNFFMNGFDKAIAVEDFSRQGGCVRVGIYKSDSCNAIESVSVSTTDEFTDALDNAYKKVKESDSKLTVYVSSYYCDKIKTEKRKRSTQEVQQELKKDSYYVIKTNGYYFVQKTSGRYYSSPYVSEAKAFTSEKSANAYITKYCLKGFEVEKQLSDCA